MVGSRRSGGKSKSPPNREFSLRFGKEEMSTEDKRRRLRRLVPPWSFLTRQRFLLEKQKKILNCSNKFAAAYQPSRSFSKCFWQKHKTPPLVQGRGRSRYHPDHAFAYLSASVSGSTRRAFARPLQTGCGPGLLKGSHCPLLSESAPERSVFQRGFFNIADILPHFLRLST